MHKAGFYRELAHGDAEGPSLEQAVGKGEYDGPELVAYLQAGEPLATTGELIDDVLDGANTGIAVLEVLTDGEWVYPSDLAYYVEQYQVELPVGLLQRAAQRGYQVPELDDA